MVFCGVKFRAKFEVLLQKQFVSVVAYFGERTHLDQSSAILDSNSEEAWGETKMRPREWELE